MQLLDCTKDELKQLLADMGQPAYRADQLYRGLQSGRQLNEITNLPADLKQRLMQQHTYGGCTVYKELISVDGTRKFLFLLEDGNIVEGVLMQYNYGNTVCISSQVGCAMGCRFCASTLGGKIRDLTAGEMLGEVIAADRCAKENNIGRVNNIVLMGSGEPLDNYDNLIKFLHLVNNKEGLNIGIRNISVSTCGLAEKIEQLAHDGNGVTLSVSLHAPNDDIRKSMMPIANRYSIARIMQAVRYYVKQTGRRAIFEYTLVDGVNDSTANAAELIALLRGLQCHVNLIPLNTVKERKLNTSRRVQGFKAELEKGHISCSVRREMGSDISGACGQLRRSVLKEDKT